MKKYIREEKDYSLKRVLRINKKIIKKEVIKRVKQTRKPWGFSPTGEVHFFMKESYIPNGDVERFEQTLKYLTKREGWKVLHFLRPSREFGDDTFWFDIQVPEMIRMHL